MLHLKHPAPNKCHVMMVMSGHDEQRMKILLVEEISSWCRGQSRASGCGSTSGLVDMHGWLTGTPLAQDKVKVQARMWITPPPETLKPKAL